MSENRKRVKDVELRLISELMKNSFRSDRELARVLKVSQPTVSRIRTKLEREGVISEYTIIPNFYKLGYHIFALTFLSWKKGLSSKEMEDARRQAFERVTMVPDNVVLIERGMGLDFDSFIASFHKDYASYTRLMREVKISPHFDTSKLKSFLVDLDDNVHYRNLTFSTLSKHLLEMNKEEETSHE
jgi:DNA-binding Lrp family transcriptional regulator